ncbi:MAG: FAD-dependent oxidoreductase, partial [Desulfobulbia bacterium]
MNERQIKDNSQIVVIGAGIVGLSTAIWLSREGFHVVIVDRCDEKKAASYGNAGVIAPSSIIPVTVPGLISKAPKMLLSDDSPLFLKWPYLPRLTPWLVRYLSECRKDRVEKISSALASLLADSVEQHQALSKGTSAEKYLQLTDYLFAFTHRSDFSA